jgi:hypothetical protein
MFSVVQFNISCNNPGQFAELVYSAVPVQFLIENHSTLNRPNYPLEKYDALRDCVFVDAFRGKCADLPAFIVFRPISRQLVVSISGSASIVHMLYNLRSWRTAHPSGRGQVHIGFLRLYEGIKDLLFDAIRQGVAKHSPTELIVTGHSMGASIAYLFMVESLAQEDPHLSRLKLRICTFGGPRVGDSDLVDYFIALVQSFREKFGQDAFGEYSIKGYNDGVSTCTCLISTGHLTALGNHRFVPMKGIPAIPPLWSGYRHFCKEPFYTIWGRMYKIPVIEYELAEFHLQPESDSGDEVGAHIFPMGGHNYYCGRDLEQFKRRTTWLLKADPWKEGWESQYMTISLNNSR